MHELSYKDRKSIGAKRMSYNDNVKRIPGIYNEKAKFIVNIPAFEKYDFFNLTALQRTEKL